MSRRPSRAPAARGAAGLTVRRVSARSALLAVLAAGLMTVVALDGTAFLHLTPLLVLLVPLLARRYPGERLLLRAVRSRGRPRPVRVLAPPARKPRATLPSGGRLIAAGLAVRPPPLLSIEV